MVLMGDIFNMYIMVEILTINAVGLTAYRSKERGALEAAFKYLVVGSIGSAFILTAMVMLYAEAHAEPRAAGRTRCRACWAPARIRASLRLLLLAGFSTKGFHRAVPSTRGGRPWRGSRVCVALLISGVLTKVRSLRDHPPVLLPVQGRGQRDDAVLLVFLGCVSMLVCVTMALAQPDFKRLLAFHSISQVGYVLTASWPCHGARPLRRTLPPR